MEIAEIEVNEEMHRSKYVKCKLNDDNKGWIPFKCNTREGEELDQDTAQVRVRFSARTMSRGQTTTKWVDRAQKDEVEKSL